MPALRRFRHSGQVTVVGWQPTLQGLLIDSLPLGRADRASARPLLLRRWLQVGERERSEEAGRFGGGVQEKNGTCRRPLQFACLEAFNRASVVKICEVTCRVGFYGREKPAAI